MRLKKTLLMALLFLMILSFPVACQGKVVQGAAAPADSMDEAEGEEERNMGNDIQGSEVAVTETEPYTLYAQTALNVRVGPDISEEKILTLSPSQPVTATGETEYGWVYITT